MISNSNKPSAFKAKPTQQQTPAGYQNSDRVAARRPVEGTAAQRQAQQRAAAQRQAQQQAAAQRQVQQQAAAQRQAQQRAAAQRQAQQQAAAQRQAQQRAAAQRQAQQQAAAQRQAQQQAAAQRRPQQPVSAQHQVQQAAAQQRAHQQTTAARATQKPVTQNRTRVQQPSATAQRPLQQQTATQRPVQQQRATTQHRIQPQAAQQPAVTQRRAPTQAAAQRPAQQTATAQRRAPAQAAAQRPAQQPAATQRRAPAQAAAQRPAQQPAVTQRRAPTQAAAQRPAQQTATAQRRAPAQAAAQRPAQQPAATQRRAPAQAAAQRPAQQPAVTQRRAPAQQPAATQRRAPVQAAAQRPAQQATTAQRTATRRVTKAPATAAQSGTAQKAELTYAQRRAQASATKKRPPQEQKLTRQEKKATKLTTKSKKRTLPATQTQPQKQTQPSATAQVKQPVAKSPVKKQRGPKQPLPPTLKGKIQYGFQQIGPTVAEIQADPYKKAIATRVIIIVLALILSIRLTSVINDILGFGRSTDSQTFTISEDDMTTNKIIGQLDRKGFIKHSVECKIFIALTDSMRSEDYTKATYLKGDYVLSKNMGIEKMLLQCMNIQRQETVEVSVPEGYNVVQIGEALEKNKVCSQEDFLKACSKTDYDFDFLQNIDNADSRYAALEGYLYPDTYEFYVGQDAESVVKKMLSNFQSKWTDEYAARAEEINMTMDQVLTMASIVQKEDSKASNMAYISSVFYNRLNSSNFPTLQSDATVNYVKEYIKPQVTETEYNTYLDLYSTYNCKGLPIGSICNPGNDAIKAVLWPQTTSYYFFAHDDDGNIYLARTANEQNANVNKAAKSSSSDDS